MANARTHANEQRQPSWRVAKKKEKRISGVIVCGRVEWRSLTLPTIRSRRIHRPTDRQWWFFSSAAYLRHAANVAHVALPHNNGRLLIYRQELWNRIGAVQQLPRRFPGWKRAESCTLCFVQTFPLIGQIYSFPFAIGTLYSTRLDGPPCSYCRESTPCHDRSSTGSPGIV